MKIVLILLSIVLSTNSYASGCMSTHVEGTISGWNKAGLVSSIGASISALALGKESDNTKKQDRIVSESYVAPGLFFYLSLMMNCKTTSLKNYKKLKEENKDNPRLKWMFAPIPTKEELEDSIEKWRWLSKITTGLTAGANLFSLSRIYNVADEDSTKNIAAFSAVLTVAATIYEYYHIYSDDLPPWANFDVVTTKVSGVNYPSLRYTFSY